MSEHRKEIDKFGEFVMKKFYDQAIKKVDMLIENKFKVYPKLRKELESFNKKQIETFRRSFIAIVGSAFHDFLFALQESHDNEEGIEIIVDDINIAEFSDGLHGELFTEDGWFAQFSKYEDPSKID